MTGVVTRIPRLPARRPSRESLLDWLRRRGWWICLATAAALGLAVWVLLFSGLFSVRTVQVLGASELVPAAKVRAAAGIHPGDELLTLDVGAVRHRIEQIPGVGRVDVARVPPGTVRLTITERQAALAIERPDHHWLIIDPKAVPFRVVDAQPPGVPTLSLPELPTRGDRHVAAALAVLAALPADIRSQVVSVAPANLDDIRFGLADKATVVWGDSSSGAAKAADLQALLHTVGVDGGAHGQRRVSVYDVSTPDFVTTR